MHPIRLALFSIVSLVFFSLPTFAQEALIVNLKTGDIHPVDKITSIHTQTVGPVVGAIRFNDKSILTGDVVAVQPLISASLSETSPNRIVSWNVRVIDTQSQAVIEQKSLVLGTPSINAAVSFQRKFLKIPASNRG